jgi:hypothetical protein
MRLWLKCPDCQAKNLLTAQVCAACGGGLVKLPPEKRVYILEPAGMPPSPPPEAPEPEAAPPEPAAGAKKARAAKPPKKKPPKS